MRKETGMPNDKNILDYMQILDIGEVTANAIVEFFADGDTILLCEKLKSHGLKTDSVSEEKLNTLEGLTFVLTGTLPTMTRDEASAIIKKYGGKVSGSVSKKTSYVVVGENAGSKERKARELQIPILTEEMFLEMLK